MDRDELGRLYDVATDDEADTLDALRERAGLIWACPSEPCQWRNQEYESTCGQCGTAKPAT